MVRWSIVSLQVRKQNWSVTLCLFLLFCVYFFDEKTCFLQGRNLGWCFCSSLYFLFFFCSVFFALFFFGLIALFFWVFCCCRVLWVALFLGSSSSSFFLYVLCLLLIKTRSLPLISPAFAGLYLPRTRSWARDVVHDLNCCRFSGLRLNQDEEDHTALPLATATFRPKDTFSLFDPWTLEIRQLDP